MSWRPRPALWDSGHSIGVFPSPVLILQTPTKPHHWQSGWPYSRGAFTWFILSVGHLLVSFGYYSVGYLFVDSHFLLSIKYWIKLVTKDSTSPNFLAGSLKLVGIQANGEMCGLPPKYWTCSAVSVFSWNSNTSYLNSKCVRAKRGVQKHSLYQFSQHVTSSGHIPGKLSLDSEPSFPIGLSVWSWDKVSLAESPPLSSCLLLHPVFKRTERTQDF